MGVGKGDKEGNRLMHQPQRRYNKEREGKSEREAEEFVRGVFTSKLKIFWYGAPLHPLTSSLTSYVFRYTPIHSMFGSMRHIHGTFYFSSFCNLNTDTYGRTKSHLIGNHFRLMSTIS